MNTATQHNIPSQPVSSKPLPAASRSELLHQLLKHYYGYDSFRGIQLDIINSICDGRDTLGLMPTGGGKSITFQIPALASQGICIVITPLIALMKDQVTHLRNKGIKATAVYTGMTHEKVLTALENCIYGDYKLLYISPERISSELFQAKLAHMKVSFICIDEAHCISQWGYDFRPSYLDIKQIRRMVPHAPVLALTATATKAVVTDIQQQLEFRRENVHQMSFERKNLAYSIRKAEDKEREIHHILSQEQGSVIVYCRNRERCKEFAKKLQEWGFTATYYHAGLNDMEKDARQKKWQNDSIRIMVATNAFGMGIDKPDVRLVLHLGVPDSIESYFQEAGRAGRDGNDAQAILLYNSKDLRTLRKRVGESYPEKQEIQQIYEDVCCFLQVSVGCGQGTRREFNLLEFCRLFHYFPTIVESALRILTRAGYIEYTDSEEGASRVIINYTRDELYSLQDSSEKTDKILQALFRRYAGLFIRYIAIDEAYVANATGISSQNVYLELKHLSKQGVITYIPRKNIPHIAFTRERRETQYITLSKHVYEERKQCMQERIEAIIGYITEENTCRNQYLLNYFGETSNHPCGQCDICLEYASTPGPVKQLIKKIGNLIGLTDEASLQREANKKAVKQSLREQIKAAGSIHPFMLDLIGMDEQLAQEAIKEMSDDGEIITDDTFRISLRES